MNLRGSHSFEDQQLSFTFGKQQNTPAFLNLICSKYISTTTPQTKIIVDQEVVISTHLEKVRLNNIACIRAT